ncbi:thiol-disulfide oxidoreductase DCC family protein [Falsihalocynthiibacter arcticus]|nr:DUF393 domain-containing protein [Falsihalocynthiibacter arcticus]
MMKSSNPLPNKTKVFFDGSCPLCSAEIGYYQTIDNAGSFEAIDVNSNAFRELNLLPHKTAMARFHVLSSSNQLLSGAEAFKEVWRGLPRWKWLARGSDFPGATWLLERVYRAFLVTRPLTVRAFLYLRGEQKA